MLCFIRPYVTRVNSICWLKINQQNFTQHIYVKLEKDNDITVKVNVDEMVKTV